MNERGPLYLKSEGQDEPGLKFVWDSKEANEKRRFLAPIVQAVDCTYTWSKQQRHVFAVMMSAIWKREAIEEEEAEVTVDLNEGQHRMEQ